VRRLFLPFRAARVERGRRRLVEILRQRFPHGLLHLADWDEEDWRDLGEEMQRGEGRIVIRIRRGLTTDDLLTRLYEGGWVLVLFERAEELEGTVLPPRIPTDDPGLFGVLENLGASAIVSSWVDDLEWTVALEPACRDLCANHDP